MKTEKICISKKNLVISLIIVLLLGVVGVSYMVQRNISVKSRAESSSSTFKIASLFQGVDEAEVAFVKENPNFLILVNNKKDPIEQLSKNRVLAVGELFIDSTGYYDFDRPDAKERVLKEHMEEKAEDVFANYGLKGLNKSCLLNKTLTQNSDYSLNPGRLNIPEGWQPYADRMYSIFSENYKPLAFDNNIIVPCKNKFLVFYQTLNRNGIRLVINNTSPRFVSVSGYEGDTDVEDGIQQLFSMEIPFGTIKIVSVNDLKISL